MRRDQNKVTLQAGVDDLADNVLVGESDDKTVLRRVVFVLGLGHQSFTGIVCTRG